MEGRERLQIDTEVPSNVFALNLHKLSELAHIPEAELVRGMQSEDAVDMQGVVVNRGQEVPFEAVGKTPEDEDDALSPDAASPSPVAADAGVKQVLLTAASSTMCLDGSDTPKCLILLGEYTLIEHILAQLFVAGMERVVIIISYFGHEIMEHVKQSFLYAKLQIEFLNLGEETPYGHARTLLSAREMFSKPFMIHTADHIFDRAIISRMAHFDLEGCVACVLVDSDKEKLKGLPSTAGKVLLDSTQGNIRKIGRGLKQFDAIDA
ncbi:Drug/Metabolite Transporter, partial [Phytophthora megakarya]